MGCRGALVFALYYLQRAFLFLLFLRLLFRLGLFCFSLFLLICFLLLQARLGISENWVVFFERFVKVLYRTICICGLMLVLGAQTLFLLKPRVYQRIHFEQLLLFVRFLYDFNVLL